MTFLFMSRQLLLGQRLQCRAVASRIPPHQALSQSPPPLSNSGSHTGGPTSDINPKKKVAYSTALTDKIF